MSHRGTTLLLAEEVSQRSMRGVVAQTGKLRTPF